MSKIKSKIGIGGRGSGLYYSLALATEKSRNYRNAGEDVIYK